MARKIEIEVTGDTRSLERALSGATKTTQSSFSKMGKAAGIAGAAIFTGLAVVAKAGFDELAESQKVMAQTGAVLKSTGGVANVTAGHVEELAGKLSDLSGVDDELIQSSENVLLTFKNVRNEVGEGNNIFDRATTAVLDMSVAMGTDLQSASIQVGKALNDPIGGMSALQRVGVTFSEKQKKVIARLVETGDKAGAQKVILEELNKEFGGSAKAAGETLPGKLAKLRNSFDETAGNLMETLLPTFETLLEYATTFAEWAQENPGHMKKVVAGIAALAGALTAAWLAQLALNLAVLANPYVLIIGSVVAFIGVAIILAKKFDFLRRHWQLFLYPLGFFPILVATIVKFAIRHFDTLKEAFFKVRDVAVAAFNAIRDKVSPVFSAIKDDITAKIHAAKAVFNVLKDVAVKAFNLIRDAISRVTGPVRTFVGWIQTAVGWVGRLAGAIRNIPTPSLPSPGGGVPFVPGIASGGDIARSGLAVVHRGERVLPAKVVNRGQSAQTSSRGTRGRYFIMADQDFVGWLRQVDSGERRRTGGRGIL